MAQSPVRDAEPGGSRFVATLLTAIETRRPQPPTVFAFVTTALLPHGVTGQAQGMQVASLDHVMWFHHPLRADQWLLYDCDSPAASGARGLARGRFYTEDGKLVASTSQEGLIRRRKPTSLPDL